MPWTPCFLNRWGSKMAGDSKTRAVSKYRRENVRQVVVRFFPKDRDLYEFVKSKPKISEYIINLIRSDMGRPQ